MADEQKDLGSTPADEATESSAETEGASPSESSAAPDSESPGKTNAPSADEPILGKDYLIDYYALLGVPRDSSQEAINQAFRKKQKEWHPDRYSGLAPEMQAEAAQRSSVLNQAQETLGNAEKRADYDQTLNAFVGPVSKDGKPVGSSVGKEIGTDGPAAKVGSGSNRVALLLAGAGVAVLVLVVVLVIVLTGGSDKTVATVGSAPVKQSELNTWLGIAHNSMQTKFPKKGTAAYKTIQGQIVSFLVQAQEYKQKSAQLGVAKVSTADVDKEIASIKKQLGGEAKFTALLKQRHLTLADARLEITNTVLQKKLYDKVTSAVTVDDAAAQAYYKSNSSQFKQPATRKVRHILIAVNKNGIGVSDPKAGTDKVVDFAKSKALATKVEGELQAGGDFAKLALKYSQDPGSKSQGGQLTVAQGQTVPEFDKVAFSLPDNQVSPPVKSQFGYHIIEALAPATPAKTSSFASVKTQLKKQLESSRKQQVWTTFQAKLVAEYKPKVHYVTGYAPVTTTTAATPSTTPSTTTSSSTTTTP
jgi:parvulin-like peptidyl-prolyl isomerase